MDDPREPMPYMITTGHGQTSFEVSMPSWSELPSGVGFGQRLSETGRLS